MGAAHRSPPLQARLSFLGEAGPGNGFQPRLRNRLAAQFTLAVNTVLDPLERLIDFVERILLSRELTQGHVAIDFVGGCIRHVHAVVWGFLNRVLRQVASLFQNAIAQRQEAPVMEGPFWRRVATIFRSGRLAADNERSGGCRQAGTLAAASGSVFLSLRVHKHLRLTVARVAASELRTDRAPFGSRPLPHSNRTIISRQFLHRCGCSLEKRRRKAAEPLMDSARQSHNQGVKSVK